MSLLRADIQGTVLDPVIQPFEEVLMRADDDPERIGLMQGDDRGAFGQDVGEILQVQDPAGDFAMDGHGLPAGLVIGIDMEAGNGEDGCCHKGDESVMHGLFR